ncbi:MAG: hypothetical protein ACFFBD_14565 [Candidatus Hodarchaeota archaeon]
MDVLYKSPCPVYLLLRALPQHLLEVGKTMFDYDVYYEMYGSSR